jgi:hypothetical protein
VEFTTAAHFSGLFSHRLDLLEQTPWIYLIVILKAKLIYIGETYDQGLIIRLSQHFGRYQTSTLKQRAWENGFDELYPPFLIVAARLPFGEDNSEFDAQSKQVRLMYEAFLHQTVIAKFTTRQMGWRTISRYQVQSNDQPFIQQTCDSIYHCFLTAFTFLENLTESSPFQLVLLDKK